MLFGEYLVKKGLVDEEALVIALDQQRQQKRPLGQIALKSGLINKKDLFKILTEQRKTESKDKSFGLIALELEILTMEQVDGLVASQSESNFLLGEVLVEDGVLSKNQLNQSLKEFYGNEDDGD
ncbi:MAG: hypothetical protein G3M70_06265 [Candidatus Nitronauta litoralis]|uniref:Type II secretion system protein GspE N-terminal domain-containing protein n=1 Tax=Candidatus Nitronauta litoralis TaxID=2705533 RepID=A0A7T0BV63_9BACT|nr:MAG: hypothetical protein G3M70_06265 [Candidatus Nitronauta litoralis]